VHNVPVIGTFIPINDIIGVDSLEAKTQHIFIMTADVVGMQGDPLKETSENILILGF
jgi:hypothetical protein